MSPLTCHLKQTSFMTSRELRQSDDRHQAALWHFESEPNSIEKPTVFTAACQLEASDGASLFSELLSPSSKCDAVNKTSALWAAVNVNICDGFPLYCRFFFPVNIRRRAAAGRASIIKAAVSLRFIAHYRFFWLPILIRHNRVTSDDLICSNNHVLTVVKRGGFK